MDKEQAKMRDRYASLPTDRLIDLALRIVHLKEEFRPLLYDELIERGEQEAVEKAKDDLEEYESELKNKDFDAIEKHVSERISNGEEKREVYRDLELKGIDRENLAFEKQKKMFHLYRTFLKAKREADFQLAVKKLIEQNQLTKKVFKWYLEITNWLMVLFFVIALYLLVRSIVKTIVLVLNHEDMNILFFDFGITILFFYFAYTFSINTNKLKVEDFFDEE